MTLNLAQKVPFWDRGKAVSQFTCHCPKIFRKTGTCVHWQNSPQNFHFKIWPRPCTTIENFWFFFKFWPKFASDSNVLKFTLNFQDISICFAWRFSPNFEKWTDTRLCLILVNFPQIFYFFCQKWYPIPKTLSFLAPKNLENIKFRLRNLMLTSEAISFLCTTDLIFA